MRTTIRTRMFFIFITVFLIQGLLIGAFFLHRHNKFRSNHVIEQLHATSNSTRSQLSLFLNTILHDLEMTSHQFERMAQKNYQQYNLLKTLQNNNPAFSALAFYDINGIIKSGVSDHKNDIIPDCFTTNPALFHVPYNTSIPYVAKLTLANDTQAMGISHPIYFLDHSYIVGVISGLVPFTTLQKIVDRLPLPPSQNLLILNSEGQVLAQKSQNGALHTAFPPEQNWDGEVTINHVRYISVSSSFEFHGQQFIIVANIDVTKSWAPTTRSFMLLSFLILLLLLLSALVGWTTNKKIIKPLQRLANSSATMIQGKGIDITPPADVELQDLANAMNTMNQQLHESNSSLEKEVRRRRREEKIAILAKIDAEKANQAKSIFLANMSHEIRTPLHGMIGMLKMFEKDSLNAEQQHLLSMMTVSGQRLHTIVDSILDLSQIESGKFQLHYSPFSLSGLVTEVEELMQLQAQNQNKDITISSEQATDIPDALVGDSGRIRQILINLLNNSIKFSERGSIQLKIDLKSKPNDIEVELLFSVTDSGSGISDDEHHTIFDAFSRGSLETGKVTEGTGLGLAISAEFVQHMQGTLWLERSDKNGSTFCFTIRCALAAEESRHEKELQEKAVATKKLSGIRIFLAEDEYINQRIISAYLEEQGGTVTVCANGQELLDTMKKEVADIILMDIRMPVLDGLETTKIIRKEEIGSAHLPIPIVALTAQATPDFEKQCRKAGMDDYLTKPIPLDRLVEIVCNLIRKV